LGAITGGVFGNTASYGTTILYGVHSGATASDPEHYMNKRAEMWARAKAWLESRGQFGDDDRDLSVEITAIEYGYDIRGRLQLEQKKDMKKRGLASPDEGDAWVLTFAEPVAPLQVPALREPDELDTFTRLAGLASQGWMG